MLSVSLKRSGRHGHEVLMGARRLSKLEFWVCIARRLGAFFFPLHISDSFTAAPHGAWNNLELGFCAPWVFGTAH